jgi:hypothetical protein
MNYELNDAELDLVSGGDKANYLLQLDGIKGESKDDGHKDEIHIDSFSIVPKP